MFRNAEVTDAAFILSLRTDDRKAMLVGIGLWLVALVVLLIFIDPLTQAGNVWWLWTCVTGIALGLLGLLYLNWRRK